MITAIVIAWVLCVLAIVVMLAWRVGFNAGYGRCSHDHRWSRWAIRREENRSTKI